MSIKSLKKRDNSVYKKDGVIHGHKRKSRSRFENNEYSHLRHGYFNKEE